ncbi:hypothetical protein GLOIN_2v1494497 [Rhizophagus irregularis DAOM 181602=DAOM 197198]|uniref:MIR domain-containing protein n=1 Tax=Rhizophagus irregularis (strain DAOM 181602 / DAOM 197198 / MUCL 43194) TaxID=747089 RepID=A0A2P4QZ83_RHIID|nr:hypothetical protein GLOIN_2v1494497 [Rhizophagus irregularis DAOM 181602=DAOM 197198]POG82868.1 hypothetical protein GLOIN_2v1494497 [Rhizophagus irregularis DAOM 181602=DAOM 197198]|eukprot:XP_025189734.1 hypothetical protein GLOIN_2v1494497 [Rhizophagus irregularis DAOM 181602=DAOM 197198]
MIHPSMNVSKANTFEEILNTLKNDILFIPFKHSVKKKLQKLKFDLKNKNYIQFINIFENIKINSLNDLINQSFLEQKSIRFGSCVTLKHVATGKYFRRYVQYKTGSKRSIVFASQALSNSNSLWILDQNNNRNPIIYGKSEVYLMKKGGFL